MHAGSQILSIGATACFIASALVLLRAHMLPTGLHWQIDAVSDYGAGAHHRYYRAMVLLLGAGGGLLLAALARDTQAGNVGLAFLGAYAAARLAIAFFMTDLPGRPPTPEGRVHLVLASIAFTSIAFASVDVTSALTDTPGWTGGVGGWLRFQASAVVVTAVLTLAAYVIPAARERVFGLVERCLYVASLAWLITTALHLATL